MFLIRSNLDKDKYVGTTVVSSIIVDLGRLMVYGIAIFGRQFSDLKDQGVLHLVMAAGISALAGSVLGTKLLRKTTFETVQKIVGILLFTVAIALMGGLI